MGICRFRNPPSIGLASVVDSRQLWFHSSRDVNSDNKARLEIQRMLISTSGGQLEITCSREEGR